MKKIWVVAIVVAVLCGSVHTGYADPFPPASESGAAKYGLGQIGDYITNKGQQSTLTQEFCDAAQTVLSSTKSKVAFDAFLASIGSQCDQFISYFACKVKIANATLGKPNSPSEVASMMVCKMQKSDEQNKKAADALAKLNSRGPENYQAPGTPTVGPAIDPKVLRQPAIDSTRIQSILIGTGLGKSKQFCEAAKVVLSTTKSKDGFIALLAEIGAKCDAFFPDFECDMMEANKGLLTYVEKMALTKCSMLKKFKK